MTHARVDAAGFAESVPDGVEVEEQPASMSAVAAIAVTTEIDEEVFTSLPFCGGGEHSPISDLGL